MREEVPPTPAKQHCKISGGDSAYRGMAKPLRERQRRADQRHASMRKTLMIGRVRSPTLARPTHVVGSKGHRRLVLRHRVVGDQHEK